MKAKLLDIVELTEPIPSESLAKGAIGVVVMKFTQPFEAYEVEFCDETGATIAQLALRPNQFTIANPSRRTKAKVA
jgi:Domain of unknown function (DUF4926)